MTVNLAAHSASGEGADALFNIEAVQGSEASDTLIGDGADNTLTGRGGADSIQGGGGNDRLDGGDGSDSADGGDGSDSCTAETVTNCELAGPPPSSGESLRIGTFNTQFLPEEFADSGCCEEIPDRAAKIAERMLASQYDIIALNEVFTDEPKETLVALLQARYPHYIQQVDDDDWAHQDSGLMLFSRFPFEPLPRDTYAALHVIARNGPGMDWNGVAYIEYANSSIGGCEGFDCWADKGVAFVRVRNPSSRRVYNLVFTHLQAYDSPAVRSAQLEGVEAVIRGTLTEEQLPTEDIIFLGDLNINGDHAAPDGRSEWERHFGRDAGFFFNGLRDAWEFETHADGVPIDRRDRGLTSQAHEPPMQSPTNSNKDRLGYILRSHPETPFGNHDLCVQHMTLAYNLFYATDSADYRPDGLGMGGIQTLSDHMGLNADINRWAPHCSSQEARVVKDADFSSATSSLTLAGSDIAIKNPGNMQWFRIDQPGAYAFELFDSLGKSTLEMAVYASANMSIPLASYRGETATFRDETGQPHAGPAYAIPEGPFYVRVTPVDRT